MPPSIAVSLDSPVPLVEQIVAGIRQTIASGGLNPGDAMPTVRQLAADLGVNMNTVARAYRSLEADGLVQSRRGRGTRVSSSAEAPKRAPKAVREELGARMREALASARLAGLSRADAEALLMRQLDIFWTKEC